MVQALWLEQRVLALDPAHPVVVQGDAADAPVGGQRTRLLLDLLGGEDALESCSTPSISPRRLISTATLWPVSSRHIRSTGPIGVGYSRRTSRQPTPSSSSWAASSSCRCASTPSFVSPGSTPSSTDVSLITSVMVMASVSPPLLVTVHRPGSSASRHGGDIQFSGL
jgi:hypothetical protein